MAEVQLNFGAGLVKINHSGPLEEIIRFISSNGYEAKTTGPGKNVTQSTSNNLRLKQALTVLSGVFAGAGMVTEWAGNDERAAVLLFIAAMVTGGFYVYKSAVSSLKSLVLDMNVLMTVSSIGAVFIGEWSEAATVVFLFSVGNMLQAYTIDRTRDSIKKMIRLAPREARRLLPGGTEETVPVDEINTGDHILVRPGENIAVDGIVISGISWADQASITGESKPVEKREGDRVFAGSINNEGSLEVKCSHPASDSTLAKMIEMVEEAQAKKSPIPAVCGCFCPVLYSCRYFRRRSGSPYPCGCLRQGICGLVLQSPGASGHLLSVCTGYIHSGIDSIGDRKRCQERGPGEGRGLPGSSW